MLRIEVVILGSALSGRLCVWKQGDDSFERDKGRRGRLLCELYDDEFVYDYAGGGGYICTPRFYHKRIRGQRSITRGFSRTLEIFEPEA